MLGNPIDPDPSTLVLAELRIKHPEAFGRESEMLLSSVLSEVALPFPSLTDFQVPSLDFRTHKSTFWLRCML